MCMGNGSGVGLGVYRAEELWRPPNKVTDSHRKRLWKLIYCGGFGEHKLFIFKDLKFLFCFLLFLFVVLNASIYIKVKRHLEVIPMGRWIFSLYDLISFALNG